MISSLYSANGVVSEKVYFKNRLSKATQPGMKLRIVRICIGRDHIAADYIKNVKNCIVNISALKNTRGNLVTPFPVTKIDDSSGSEFNEHSFLE